MKVLLTDYQKNMKNKPTRFEVLGEIEKRGGLINYPKLHDEYKRLLKGYEGENRLIHHLETFGADHWVILKNVWLEYFGEFEIDVLLMTRAGIYGFEVKNYTGKIELLHNQFLLNGRVIGHNAIGQTQKLAANLNQIINKNSARTNVKGVLTFIGESNPVTIHDEVTGIDILLRNELLFYIREMRDLERKFAGVEVNVDTVLNRLSEYEIGRASKQKEVPLSIRENVRKGICCRECGEFNLEPKNSYVICKCGMHEPREEAIVRTICEYGILHYEKNLKTSELTKFFDGFITQRTLQRYMKKHFKRVGASSGTEYLNDLVSPDLVAKFYALNAPLYLKISD